MGNKGAKPVTKKPPKLSSKDYKFLTKQTGLTKDQINEIFAKFVDGNADAALDKAEFTRLYAKLRPEPAEAIDEIASYVFEAFDTDNNGTVNFNEFLVAYAMTSRGNQKDKLEYAFELYDCDDNGTLDRNELKAVIYGMLDMLGADRRGHNSNDLAIECMSQLDDSKDGLITKDEFVSGLMENYSLRALMSPFN